MKKLLSLLLCVPVLASAEFNQTGECIRDTDTNLTWYVAPGTYTWFDTSIRGTNNLGDCPSNNCDTDKFIKSLSVCGLNNWRLPVRHELESLLNCPQGRSNDWVHGYPCTNYKSDGIEQHIKSQMFTVNGSYWVNETYQVLPDYAWFVDFKLGSTNRSYKSDKRGILAVTNSDVKVTPKTLSCNYPTYSNGLLNIPSFAPNQPVSSATLKLDFTNDKFYVINAR